MSTSISVTSEVLRQRAKHSLAQGDVEKAERFLAEALEAAPDDHEVLVLMAELRLGSGRLTDAFYLYVRAVNAAPEVHLYKERFLELAARGVDIIHSDALESAVAACLKTPELAGAVENWAALLMANPQFRSAVGLANRDPLSLDVELLLRPLFLEGLKSNVVCDPSFEALITQIRFQLLNHFSMEGRFPREEYFRLASALSHYAFFTDFILEETERERDLIDELQRKTEREGPENADAIALLACYRPLYALANARDMLATFRTTENLADVVRTQVGDYLSLSQAAWEIPTLAPVADETSHSVREQYEAFPYPRWKALPKRQVVEDWRADEISRRLEAPLSDQPAKILIAGCGTGRDAAIHAVRFAGASITAVDVSRVSLAYASLKAKELGLENLTFVHADILDLGRMGQVFDHICCTGVLHHMDDPLKGWRVLRDLLRPGGLMRIGLYSRAGREAVAAAQDAARNGNYPPTRDGLLSFRRDCPRLCGRETVNRLSRLQDYYHLNMYRDLLFPAREHRFDLAQIGDMLGALGLRFEGFYVSADVLRTYRSLFRDDRHATDLETWRQFESRYPDTFASMYIFWCRKP
jgi:SAM-dependent methyltransferase